MGIYVKDKNEMSDVIPDFILGSDIEGNRIIQLNVEQDETITLTDSTGAKIASGTEEELSNQGYTEDVITKNGYTKSSEETNKAENLTAENYEKSNDKKKFFFRKNRFCAVSSRSICGIGEYLAVSISGSQIRRRYFPAYLYHSGIDLWLYDDHG